MMKTAEPLLLFSYGQVEAALAKMHAVPAEAIGTFRARLKHFQRIGLVPISPGKGQRISYTVGDVAFWAMCFELAEFGVAPAVIKGLTKNISFTNVVLVEGAESAAGDVLFFISCEFLKWQIAESDAQGALKWTMFGYTENQMLDLLAKEDRLLIINITKIKQKLGKALSLDWSKIHVGTQARLADEFRRKEGSLGR